MLFSDLAKRLLIDLLLTASPNQDGLRDVITGRADAFEPVIDNHGSVSPLQFGIGAMVLRAVENEHEEPVLWLWSYPDDQAYILHKRRREAWGECEGNGGRGQAQEQCQQE